VTPVIGQEDPVPNAPLDAAAARTTAAVGVAPRPRRLPATVGAAATVAGLESLGLLALGLTGLDGVFGTGARPDGLLVALCLLVLAGWVVLCAGGGAGLLDGAGRHLLVSVACGELALLLVLGIAGAFGAGGVAVVALGGLPLPALALLGLGVPTAKLLLATSPSAVGWVAAGGRPRTARPARRVEHPGLRATTVVCIGLALTSVALLGGPSETAAPPSTASVAAP
jgi:hypothetical protein